MSTELVRTLYGAPDGTWLFVESPVGLIPPPHIDVSVAVRGEIRAPSVVRRLESLGPPYDLFTMLLRDIAEMPTVGVRGRNGQIPVQQTLGDLFGVSQQSISRYANGSSEPHFTDADWRLLVRLRFDPGLAVSAIVRLNPLPTAP